MDSKDFDRTHDRTRDRTPGTSFAGSTVKTPGKDSAGSPGTEFGKDADGSPGAELGSCLFAGPGAWQVKLAKALMGGKKLPPECEVLPDADRLFICEGDWAISRLIQREIEVPLFLVCPERVPEGSVGAVKAMRRYAGETVVISGKICDKISERDGSDYCFVVGRLPVIRLGDLVLKENMTAIVLDGQEQPGKIGAILRSLDAAGGDFAVYVNRRCRMTHPRLIRSSLGAAFMMPFVAAEWDELTGWLGDNGFKAIVTDLTAKASYLDADYSGRVAIICGNEYKGISPEWKSVPFAVPVIIPMFGSVESLNVGFAATLVAYESALRQRGVIRRN